MYCLIKYHILIVYSLLAIQSPPLAKSGDANQRITDLYQIINATKHSNADSLSYLYSNLGSKYAHQMKYDSAYKYYYLSLKIANETSDTLQLAAINNIIGSFFYKCENYEEAFEYYWQSYVLYKKINIQKGIASLANNLGEIKRLNGDYDKALKLYYSAIKINSKLNHYYNLSLNHNNIGLTYASLENYDSSFYHLKLAEKIALEHNLTSTLNNILNSIGTYYLQIKKYDSSYYYLSNAYKQSLSKNLLIQIRENSNVLSQLFEITGNLDSAFYYHKVFKCYNDTILKNKNFIRMGLLMNRTKTENERRIEKIERNRKELFYFIIFISVFSILLIIFLLWINQRNKTRHSQLKLEHMKLEKKFLTNELSNFALHISENNRLIEEIKQSLKQIDSDSSNIHQLNTLKLRLNTGLSSGENRMILEQKVDEHHHEFIQFLKNNHPSLTKSELKLCSLLKLNLSTKDIAAINRVSPQAIKIARYRLRKKIKLESEISIADYLNSIKFD